MVARTAKATATKAAPAKTAPAKATRPARSAKPSSPPPSTPRGRASTPKPVVEEEEDLLAGLEGDAAATTQTDDDEELDLLDDISEDAGVAWVPATDGDQPDGIQGRVVNRTVIYADDAYGGGEVPLLEIEEKGGEVWSVRGYHTVLRNQIEKNDPEVGDLVAIKYFGPKTPRSGGKDYENYGMKCPACDKRKRSK